MSGPARGSRSARVLRELAGWAGMVTVIWSLGLLVGNPDRAEDKASIAGALVGLVGVVLIGRSLGPGRAAVIAVVHAGALVWAALTGGSRVSVEPFLWTVALVDLVGAALWFGRSRRARTGG